MQKKIGIVTFHNSVNYGAVLQTYALSRTLLDDGYSVEVIDYKNEKIESELQARGRDNHNGIKDSIKAVIKKYHGYRKSKSFSKFNETKIKLSTCRNIDRNHIAFVKDLYDVLITGSDQVWNLDLTGNDITYYLDFASDDSVRLAYAVSVGDVVDANISGMLPYIQKFKAISVREQSLRVHSKEKYGIASEICCDPTLLADRSIFLNIMSKRLIKSKYIFCFLMEFKQDIIEVARRIAEQKGLIVIDNKSSYQFFLHSEPEDFLSWIYNAEYVLTDSFHGTVFSVIFKKQFISDQFDTSGKTKRRVEDVLKAFKIGNQFMPIKMNHLPELEKHLFEQINYDDVEQELGEMSQKSHKWLISSIEDKQ